MKTYLLLPPGQGKSTIEAIKEELGLLDVDDVFDALTSAWETEDLIELAKLLTAHVKGDGGRVQ
jgi:hypothetical protein